MAVCYYSSFRQSFVVYCVSLTCTCVMAVTSQKRLFASQTPGQTASLQSIQQLVRQNENLISLVKLDYTVRYSQSIPQSEIEPLMPQEHKRRRGRPYTHYTGVWAQDGIKQYSDTNFFYGPDDPARGDIFVIDGEVMKWGNKPDLMQGGINYIDKFRWPVVGPAHLGLRPFDGKQLLSELLVPQYASVHHETQVVEDREAFVVDVYSPAPGTGVRVLGRIWIDSERGAPLRLEYYHVTPTTTTLTTEIKSIKLKELQNGGWTPVEGMRVSFWEIPKPYQNFSHIVVDTNSITIRREDIPDSLFTLNFPKGARIYNAITDITTEAGRVWDPKLKSIIEKSIETLDIPDVATGIQTTTKASPNEPLLPTDEDTSRMLVDTHPGGARSLSVLWILLPAFLAALALTIIILILRSHSQNTSEEDIK